MKDNTQLIQFLASPDRPEGTLNYHQLQGFLFAVTCSPEIIVPSEWMPLIFNEQEANYSSMDEAESITQALMVLYNDINAQVFEGSVRLPDDITVADAVMDNIGEGAPLGQWSIGYFMGHDWLVELWDQYTPDALSEELGSCMMILGLFSDPKLADAFYQEIAASSSDSFEEYVGKMLGMFDNAMSEYAHLGRSIQTALVDQASQPVVSKPKVGRNEPCPCGSGKKYKKCCLH
jgi:uncharacterized protein